MGGDNFTFAVRMLFNEEAIAIPGCGTDTICPFEQFKEIYSEELAYDFHSLCGIDSFIEQTTSEAPIEAPSEPSPDVESVPQLPVPIGLSGWGGQVIEPGEDTDKEEIGHFYVEILSRPDWVTNKTEKEKKIKRKNEIKTKIKRKTKKRTKIKTKIRTTRRRTRIKMLRRKTKFR